MDGVIVSERPAKRNKRNVVKKITKDAIPMVRCFCSGRGIRLNNRYRASIVVIVQVVELGRAGSEYLYVNRRGQVDKQGHLTFPRHSSTADTWTNHCWCVQRRS